MRESTSFSLQTNVFPFPMTFMEVRLVEHHEYLSISHSDLINPR